MNLETKEKSVKFMMGPLGIRIRVEDDRIGIYSMIKALCEVLDLQIENKANGEGYRMMCRIVHGLLIQLNTFH